jgi:hypothetical protein
VVAEVAAQISSTAGEVIKRIGNCIASSTSPKSARTKPSWKSVWN